MDPLLAALEGGNTDSKPAPQIQCLPESDSITVVGANYWQNPENKGTWMASKETITIQFYTHTERFKPHFNNAAANCAAQMHSPDFVCAYIEDYKREYAEDRHVPTDEQMAWLTTLTHDTVDNYPEAKIGLLYDKFGGGTRYHWGSILRIRYNKYDEMLLDIFLNCERFKTITMDQPNQDNNEKTKKIKLRGRHDPLSLWIASKTRKAKA